MKIRRKRFVLITIIMIAIFIIMYLLDQMFEMNFSQNSSTDELLCEITPQIRIKMSETLSLMLKALHTLDITYFLCYDSLWGALRVKGPLKWHQTIELCLLNEEVSHLDEAFLIRTFNRKGLSISYQSSNGVYLVNKLSDSTDSKPIAKLYLFEEDVVNNNMRRVGWKNRLVPPDSCQIIHCFPPRLISKPLPTEYFMDHKISVPREQIEIQKYLFSESWWKDLEPQHCKH